MHEELKALVRAIATTNGHPDPDSYANQVTANFTAQNEPAAPAPDTEPAPAA